MSTLRRVAPAVALLVLSPLVAEFLLGDFSVRQLGFIVAFLPQYGGGALLVREIARRAHRGWPTILLLALAYSLIEEGFTTQTLFNPNYAGQRLLDYGFIPALGTSLNWAVFVLTLHVVWSVGTCIAIAEGIASPRWSSPWLGRLGLTLTVALFLVGCAMTTAFTLRTFPFVATPMQFAAVALVVIAVVAAAFVLFPGNRPRIDGAAPSPWLVGVVSLVLSSGFYLLFGRGPSSGWPSGVTLAAMLALELIAIGLFTAWSRRSDWGPIHALGAATGAVLTYGWLSIPRIAAGSTALGTPTTALDVAGQVILLALILVVIGVAARRLRRLT